LLTCDASDPDGDELAFHWTITGNVGSFVDPDVLHPTFITPAVEHGGRCAITVTLWVTDVHGASACDSMVINVVDVNAPPRVDLGPDIALVSGSAIRLKADVRDPDGEPVHYQWLVPAGQGEIGSPCDTSPAYRAPVIPYGDEIHATVTLVVTDARGASSSDSLRIHVRNPVPSPSGQ
jgi:hypothetical protein